LDRVIILDADMASAFAKIFSSIDAVALRFAEENGVETLELHSILRSLRESSLQSKEEVREIITAIEKKDNTRIKDVDAVFR
jgi:hypothetical protein